MNTNVIIYTLHWFGGHLLSEHILHNVHHVFVANCLTGAPVGIFIGENGVFLFCYKRLQHLCLKIYA